MQKKWVYLTIAIIAISALVSALVWYQPWRIWQTEHLVHELQNPSHEVRQQALTELYSWRLIQRQRLLQQSQAQLLGAYEHAINVALARGEWRNAQLWLQDLQRLYPQLPAAQAAQLKVAAYVAQQVNMRIAEINQLLATQHFLTPPLLGQLQGIHEQLKELNPDHALLYDRRIMYGVLLSIDEALAVEDFNLAQHLLNWGVTHFPNEAELQDRQVQVSYRLAGRPAQVLATCISQGQDCWKITSTPALFSRPWLLQKSIEHPWMTDWSMATVMQEQLGNYYRQQALQAYAQQQFMQASINLLRTSYFVSSSELSEYWQWLAFAFIEREQKEYQQAQQAKLSGLHHTLISQVAALDVVGAQNTVVAMQSLGADPWFIDNIALPMLGETYLKLAQQLANAQQYEVAMRLLIAGEQFLPKDNAVQQLLAEYKETNAWLSPSDNLPMDQQLISFPDASLFDGATLEVLGLPPATPPPNLNAAHTQESCAASSQAKTVRTCQDVLALQGTSQANGPLLVVPPPNQRFAKSFAISKYPISIREYNYYCHISKQCMPRAIPQAQNVKAKNVSKVNLPGEMNLNDVQEVMQEYDDFCRDTGTCNSIEPHAQDLPLTDIKLEEALQYARWLSSITGQNYRLPMADEWRYAILSDEIYRCSYNTLLESPKKMVPVQQGVSNRWGVVHELGILREWVHTPDGVATIGPEKPESLPVCILPLNNNQAAMKPDEYTGIRLVREL
ncbi:MAG: SUMF1/EgtB/PvdO family nonheme iron enzyme [Gammaproteobacteria bacterium]